MMEDGVVLCVTGGGKIPAMGGVEVRVGDADQAFRTVVLYRQPGEHLAGCVRRAAELALVLAGKYEAVGLAAGPVLGDVGLRPTADRACRALGYAQPGDVILAWGSQAYLQGEFASVATGFVRLVHLA